MPRESQLTSMCRAVGGEGQGTAGVCLVRSRSAGVGGFGAGLEAVGGRPKKRTWRNRRGCTGEGEGKKALGRELNSEPEGRKVVDRE